MSGVDEPWEDDINVGFEFLEWLLSPAEGEKDGTRLGMIINKLDAGDRAMRATRPGGTSFSRFVQEDLERWLERLTP